ncbi:MAG: hypothetical protein ACP5MG_03000 [Verrucomicrobiia bacterium]|jgi:hypothetical protein
MKTIKIILIAGLATPLLADLIPAPQSKPGPPPPIYFATDKKQEKKEITAGTNVYDQKPAPPPPMLITPEQAKGVIDRFKEGYPKLGSPRFLIYINRELIDTRSGVLASVASAKTQRATTQIDSTVKDSKAVAAALGITNTVELPPGKYTKQTENVTINQTLKQKDKPEPSLADRQTARDIERLFGRPLRAAGATLVDHSIAVQMMEGKPVKDFLVSSEGDVAKKEREAIKKIADVVIEVLVSSKQVTLPGLTGDITYNVPDIQATAVRLSDSKIIGQAASADIISRSQRPVQYLNVYEVAEATALVLMEDMLLSVK